MSQSTIAAPVTVETDSTPRVWPMYDHEIGITEAREMIARYKRANPDKGSALAVTRIGMDRVLNQPGCAGARFYFALNAENRFTLVMVGVDELGNDMDEGELAERFLPCPPACSPLSMLDS